MRAEMRIGLGIPLLDVDSIDDSVELEREAAQDSIESRAMLARLDFTRVRRRNRRDLIGQDDAALHQIEVAEMLERVRRPIAAVQSERHEALHARDALIVEIVDRVNRSRVSERAAAPKSGVEINGQQRGVPVVRVDNVRRNAEALAAANNGPAEEREALDAV